MKLAAGKEARRLAGDRAVKIGLGENRDQPFSGQRIDHRRDIVHAIRKADPDGGGAGRRACQLAGAVEGLTPGDEAEAEVADLADGIPVDPELLGDAARDFGDANSEIDLYGARHLEPVVHDRALPEELGGDRPSGFGGTGVRDGPGRTAPLGV